VAGARERVGDGEGFGLVGFVVEPGGDEQDERGNCGENVVLLPGGEREEEHGDEGPEAEEEACAFGLAEGADGDEWTDGFAPGDGVEGAEEKGAPGHEPDEDEAPEEKERDGVVVARDTEVEVAEEVLVDEVEPEPAVDVAVGGKRNGPVAVGEGEVAGMALGWVRNGDKDVPGCGDEKEDDDARERV